MSALHDAARGDDPDAVAAVLAQGLVEINTRDKLSRTALIIASWAGKVFPARLPPQTSPWKRAPDLEVKGSGGERSGAYAAFNRPEALYSIDALTFAAAFHDALRLCCNPWHACCSVGLRGLADFHISVRPVVVQFKMLPCRLRAGRKRENAA